MDSALSRARTRLLLAFAIISLCIGAFAQGGSGELAGLVTDPTGAVIPGAPVKLTNSSTGEVRTATTSAAGTYRFPALQVVGTYTLEISPEGFKSAVVKDIIMTVGTIVTRDVRLEVGHTSDQVTVEAGAQLVQTEDSSLSQNVDRQVWTNMPLEDRSSNDFLALLPGAEPGSISQVYDRGPAVNGTRPGSGNFMVEGFNNNDQGLGGAGTSYGASGALTTISPDAIEEYRVIDGTPPAEYGRSGGFVTDTVLKSGTNQWHGSLFEYNRIQALAANSFFSNLAGQQDHLIRNQFGGSVGGPIIKDKTFFYFTVEAHRLRTSTPVTANTITSDFLNFVNSGNFETFMETSPNGLCNNANLIGAINYTFGTGVPVAPCPGVFAADATLGPVYSSMQNQEKLPLCSAGQGNCTNLSAASGGVWTSPNVLGLITLSGAPPAAVTYPVDAFGTITAPGGQTLNQMRYATKVDHKLSARDQMTGSYLYDYANAITPYGGNNLMGPAQYYQDGAQNAGISWLHTFSPTILNQARFSYTRNIRNFPGDPSVLGMPDVYSYFDSPTIGYGNSEGYPQFFTTNEFVWKDDLSITKGKHNFKTGAEYSRTRDGSSFDLAKYGLAAATDTEDMVTDTTFTNLWENYAFGGQVFGSIAEAQGSFNPVTGTLPLYYRGYRSNDVAAYFQDDWRIHPRLTLNLGLRWEYFGPPHNFQPNIDSNFYTGVPVTPIPNPGNNPFFPVNSPFYAGIATGAFQVRNHDLWNKDLNNFGPRVGLSFDALGNQKVVVRAGFGINYDRMYNNIFENIRFNPPYFEIGLLASPLFGFPGITPEQGAALYTNPFVGTSVFAGAETPPSTRAMDQNLVTPYYEQAHIGLQYEIAKDVVLESNYVATFGHKLQAILGVDTYDGRVADGFTPSLVNPNYSQIGFRQNCCNSNYHGWQTTLRKRFSGGLQFNANYTYAKAMDDASDVIAAKIVGAADGYPMDPTNPKVDYGIADYDVRHRVVANFVYDLPFAKSNRWIGGWNISGIVSWQSGAPFSVYDAAVDSNKDGEFTDRSSYIGSGKINNAIIHNHEPYQGYLVAADFAQPGTPALPCPASVNMGLWCEGRSVGQMERNTLSGPGFFNTDVGLKKGFKITETSSLKFEANFFNLFNHPNFLLPDGNFNDVTFGQSQGTFSNAQTGGPRITQLALRFEF